MDLYILMTVPPQPPLSLSLSLSLSKTLSHSLSTPRIIKKSHAMNHPRTQFSRTFNHNLNNPFAKNDPRLSQNDGICSNSSDQEFVQFRPNFHHQELMDSDDSGVCSPPLWKSSSPTPPRSPSSQPLLSHHVRRSLSPNSRTQAIARGQRELMEMVKNMPESSYELSLKDLVEHHKIETQTNQSNNQTLHRRVVKVMKRQESRKNDKNMMRVESFQSRGLFLKMVFPFSLKSKKKKNFVTNSGSSGRVSPKPEVVKGGGEREKERDWWKKRFTGSSDSDSSRASNNSGSTGSSSSGGGSSSGRSDGGGGRKKSGLLTGCWPFFHSRSSKSVE